MPPIKTTEEWQNLVSQVFGEDVELDPAQVERFFVTNLVGRSLAHLVGQGKTSAKLIRATEAGAAVTAPTATAFEDYDLEQVTFADDNADDVEFSQVVSRVDITIWTNPVLFRLSPDGTRWGGWIEQNADSAYSFDCNVTKLQIKNKNAGSNARYQIVGWY